VSATVIDVRELGQPGADNIPNLGAFLLQLVGEPFQFARFSYGDELTLHFGTLREATHPKLCAAGVKYGAYILRTRGSAWLIKPGAKPVIVTEGLQDAINPEAIKSWGKPLTHREVESNDFLIPGTWVVKLYSCPVDRVGGIGFRVDLSDGSSVIVIPTPTEPAKAESPTAPELADWELRTPHGTARVGPGQKWILVSPSP